MGDHHPDYERRLTEIERTMVRRDVFDERTKAMLEKTKGVADDVSEMREERRDDRRMIKGALITGLVGFVFEIVLLVVVVQQP